VGTEWIRVRHGAPCPICEADSWCTVSADGKVAHCMRGESAKAVKSGGWIHDVGGANVVALVERNKAPETRPYIRWDAEARRMYECERASRTRAELAQQLGVSVESLELLGVGWGADFKEFASFPMRGIRGRYVGIVRRYQDGAKKTMKWSRCGLFHAENYLDFGGPVLIPEGASDVAALMSMGLCAVGRPSNVGGVLNLVALLTNVKRKLIVLAENDAKPEKRGKREWCPANCVGCGHCFAGLFGAIQTASELGRAFQKRVEFRFPPDGAKDVRAWVQTHGLNGRKFLSGLRSP